MHSAWSCGPMQHKAGWEEHSLGGRGGHLFPAGVSIPLSCQLLSVSTHILMLLPPF